MNNLILKLFRSDLVKNPAFRSINLVFVFRVFFFILVATFLLISVSINNVYAGLPSSVSGKVYIQLPTGEQLPLSGIPIVRTDYDSFEYCEDGKVCFGTKHTVSVLTDSVGSYLMGNSKDSRGVSCFQKVPAGSKYACSTSGTSSTETVESLPECSRDLLKNYSGIYTQGLNWCGFYGFSTPHRYQPVFSPEYRLPGNLSNLGYSVGGGSWKTVDANDPNKLLESPYYEDSLGSYADFYRRDFIFVLDPLKELEINVVESFDRGSDDFVGCKSLVGIASKDGIEYLMSELPEEFSGTLLLTCIAETKGSPLSRIDFTFEKSVGGEQTLQSKSVQKPDLVSLSVCTEGYSCYSATADFDLDGVGNYKVTSRVCNENNLCSK